MAAQATPSRKLPGFTEELAQAELDIVALIARRLSHSDDLEKRVRLAYRLFHKASLTGSMIDFDAVDAALRETLEEFGPKEDLCLLKANLDFRFHRIDETRRDLEMCPLLSGRFEGRTLLADLAFQEGRYESARLELERLVVENQTWDNLARLAHWKGVFGDVAEADQLYQEAEDLLTAKQMRSYSWLEIQRGALAFTHGRYDVAWTRYERAADAYPGHWYTDEHFAELLAAEGRFDEAIELLRLVIARTHKPELQQALGELYVFSGRPKEAEPWFAAALQAYLESVECGGVHYYHHLADFYASAREDPPEAVRWARKDLELRSNYSTQAAMAWALYRNGQPTEAIHYIRLALSSGVKDARIFSMAATLFDAAGETAEAQDYAQAAILNNSKHQNFHLHH